MMIKVFVYGTLRKGEANHHFLEKATCVAEQCWTYGIMYDTGFGYPAVTQADSFRIYGELYSVTENELVRLDELEGYSIGGKNNLYDRIQQTIYSDQGETIAYLYVGNKENLTKKKIPNGDWKDYRVNKKI